MDVYKIYNDLCTSADKLKEEIEITEKEKGVNSPEARMLRWDLDDLISSITGVFEDPLFVVK